MIITLIIMEIIIAMAMKMDTTKEPDTRSAGISLKLFSNFIVFIFFLLNYDKQKTSLQLITAERLEFLFLIPFLSTITSRTAADNNGGDNNNHAVNVVEKLSHLILISFEISLIYHIFFIISRGEERKIIIFLILSLPWI